MPGHDTAEASITLLNYHDLHIPDPVHLYYETDFWFIHIVFVTLVCLVLWCSKCFLPYSFYVCHTCVFVCHIHEKMSLYDLKHWHVLLPSKWSIWDATTTPTSCPHKPLATRHRHTTAWWAGELLLLLPPNSPPPRAVALWVPVLTDQEPPLMLRVGLPTASPSFVPRWFTTTAIESCRCVAASLELASTTSSLVPVPFSWSLRIWTMSSHAHGFQLMKTIG
jgi:hypothetical protein